MRKNYITTAIVLLTILCFIPRHGTFAAEKPWMVVEAINMLIKIASRARTVIAVLAGKLMSNDWVYASWLGLDKSLFTMRNYMKNIANFVLWFMLVIKIAQSLFDKNEFKLKKELPNFLLASVLVNMSWFIMGALIDMSNVATAAVGSFPQSFISENPLVDKDIAMDTVKIPSTINVSFDDMSKDCTRDYTTAKDTDRMRARFNDMSWPLLYLWTSIYRFQDYCIFNQWVDKVTDIKDFTIGQIIKIIQLIMFIAPLIALFFINLQRVFFLWLWIVFAPIIVLLEIMKVKVDLGKMKETFSFKEIVGMIFQPVLTIGGMAIVLLLSVSMYHVMGWKSATEARVSHVFGSAEVITSTNESTFHNAAVGSQITYIGDIFKDASNFAGGLVWYLIITVFVVFLLWAVVKMSTQSSKIAASTFKKVADLWESLVGGMNIVPIGWGKTISLASAMKPGDALNSIWWWLTQSMATKSDQGLKSAFYNSAYGKKIANAYKIDPSRRSELDNDIDVSRSKNIWGSLQWIKKEDGLKVYFSRLRKQLIDMNNKLWKKSKYITPDSKNFRELIATTLLGNADLKKELADDILKIDPSALSRESLFDGSKDVWQKFMNWLQQYLKSWNANYQAGFKVGEIPDGFTIYGDRPEEDDTEDKEKAPEQKDEEKTATNP